VKLVAGYNSTGGGQTLQFTDEQNANTHTVNTYLGIGSLRISRRWTCALPQRRHGDNHASYAVNGGAFQAVPGTVTLTGSEEGRVLQQLGLAGIMASAKNNLAPVTVGFTHF